MLDQAKNFYLISLNILISCLLDNWGISKGEGVKYRKNEVFLDVIESVNLLVGYPCLRFHD